MICPAVCVKKYATPDIEKIITLVRTAVGNSDPVTILHTTYMENISP